MLLYDVISKNKIILDLNQAVNFKIYDSFGVSNLECFCADVNPALKILVLEWKKTRPSQDNLNFFSVRRV